MAEVGVIGAGLAGCEAAHILAKNGVKVRLYEMKPKYKSMAHSSDSFAELVCSNSLKATRLASAAGLLKAELRMLGSLILECAESCAVPAGGALAVDRDEFSRLVTERILSNSNIEIIHEQVNSLPEGEVIIATGPLTSDGLIDAISPLVGNRLSFHDASSPIVMADSIDFSKVFRAARYGRGGDDYINCPLERDEYYAFIEALTTAERVELSDYEKEFFRVYEGCMPVEIMAGRGVDTLRFGPLRPVGITSPKTGRRPFANIQLRQENSAGTMYNIVGFQTNLKFPEQKRVFSMIPGLENAEFVRYGVMHRNTFINSPQLLDSKLRLKSDARISFAGQIVGVEGYMESAAAGLVAGMFKLERVAKDKLLPALPTKTMLGALLGYISDSNVADFQPMNANMGILPPLNEHIKGKEERYLRYASISLEALGEYIKNISLDM